MSNIKITAISHDDVASLSKIFSDPTMVADLRKKIDSLDRTETAAKGFYIVEGHFDGNILFDVKQEIQKVFTQKADFYNNLIVLKLIPTATPQLIKPIHHKAVFATSENTLLDIPEDLDIIIGGNEPDKVDIQQNRNIKGIFFYGGGGNDSVLSTHGHDYLAGGAGDDRLIGLWGNDIFWGGPGNNIYNVTIGHNDAGSSYDQNDDVINLDPTTPGDDVIILDNRVKPFKETKGHYTNYVTMWSDQDKIGTIYALKRTSINEGRYEGMVSITINGLTDNQRKLFWIDNDPNYQLEVYEIEYFNDSQNKTLKSKGLLHKAAKEIFLPKGCTLKKVTGPNGQIMEGVAQRLVIDNSEKQVINNFFGVR